MTEDSAEAHSAKGGKGWRAPLLDRPRLDPHGKADHRVGERPARRTVRDPTVAPAAFRLAVTSSYPTARTRSADPARRRRLASTALRTSSRSGPRGGRSAAVGYGA